MKTIYTAAALAVILVVGGSLISRSLQSNDPNSISTSGIHWHPQLRIIVRGEQVLIPSNIGVGPTYSGRPRYGDGGMAMTPIHTHDDMPVIHLEFSGLVRTDDITLGKFFETWDRDIESFGTVTKMTVNGVPSVEFGDYVMRDGDKIELHYD